MLKTILVAAVATLLLTAGTAIGSANWQRTQHGVLCQSTVNESVICIRADGTGYAMAFNKNFVFVTNEQNRRIFLRYQP